MKHLIVDGNNVAHRSFAVRPGSTDLFFRMIDGLVKTMACQKILFCFDGVGLSPLRLAIYPDYKNNGSKGEIERADWWGYLDEVKEQLVKNLQCVVTTPEADDGIASVVRQVQYWQNSQFYIVSNDSDLLQLISANVLCLRFPKTFSEFELWDGERVDQRYHLHPYQLSHLKALVGGHDNLPGVRGIGPVIGTRLIQRFNGLHQLYAALYQVEKERIRNLLTKGRRNAFLSFALATLCDYLPIEFSFKEWPK